MQSKIDRSIHLKTTITTFIEKPYRFYYEGKHLSALCWLIFLMTFVFNYGFEPFHIDYNEHKMSYGWISMIHSFSPVIVLLALALLVKIFQLNMRWRLIKEVAFLVCFFILTGITQFLIRDLIYHNENNWSMHYLIEEIRNTLLAGSLFCIILIPYHRNRFSRGEVISKYLTGYTTTDTEQSQSIKENKIKIHDFDLLLDQFLFAKAEGNYLEIYLNIESQHKLLIRMTLKDFESLLKPYPHIVKTHRSYIINCHQIKKVTGNAQGYLVHIQRHVIPVSRNNIKYFNSKTNLLSQA